MNQTADVDVSVIIPAYNVTGYIKEALDSVWGQSSLEQDATSLEIIVVNDGCPDTAALEHVLTPYFDQIVYIKKENGGVSSARNTGIRAAQGKWLAFLDADDVWLPTYLESQLKVLKADPKVDMVFPNGIIFGDTALAGRHTMDFSPADGEITFQRVLAGEITIAYCALVRRDLIIQVGMFDVGLRGSEDFHLWLRVLKAGARIVSQKAPLYRYRRRTGSLTADEFWMNSRILESLQRAEETIPLSAEEHQALERHRRKIEAEMAAARGKDAFEKREWNAAVQHYSEAHRLIPKIKLRVIVLLLQFCPVLLYSLTRRGKR
jgi:glycosyltransferase involved in cell wall biosynthesis